jgi:hypothetical protein
MPVQPPHPVSALSLPEFTVSHTQASTSPFILISPAAPTGSRWFADVMTVIGAMLRPGPLVRDVERMGKLLREADRIEGQDPVRAQALRREASLIIR